MADFALRATGGITVRPFVDPPRVDGTAPTRLNQVGGHRHLYQRALVGGPAVEFRARLGGVTGPLDTALGGRLFSTRFVEIPTGASPPPVSHPAGQTSRVTFTPIASGHYSFLMSRPGGGRILTHVHVED